MTKRIATWLNNQGYRARSGKPWHHASIRGILCNLTYTGVLRSGESRSPVQEHLRIITTEQYAIAQRIREARADSASMNPRVPLNTRGQSLLAGNVYCGHCESRLALTTNGKAYPCAADPNRVVKRIRYICYGKTRKQTACDGQTGYTAHILDGIVDKVVHHIFEQMWTVNKSEIVSQSYRDRMTERKALLEAAKRDHAKAAGELATLRAEVVNSIRGESSFSTDTLGTLIHEAESKCAALEQKLKSAQAAYEEGQALMATLNTQYDAIIGWPELYDGTSIETKKMIVSCLIKRIDVYRDYRVHIDFNIDFEQFRFGLDLRREQDEMPA